MLPFRQRAALSSSIDFAIASSTESLSGYCQYFARRRSRCLCNNQGDGLVLNRRQAEASAATGHIRHMHRHIQLRIMCFYGNWQAQCDRAVGINREYDIEGSKWVKDHWLISGELPDAVNARL